MVDKVVKSTGYGLLSKVFHPDADGDGLPETSDTYGTRMRGDCDSPLIKIAQTSFGILNLFLGQRAENRLAEAVAPKVSEGKVVFADRRDKGFDGIKSSIGFTLWGESPLSCTLEIVECRTYLSSGFAERATALTGATILKGQRIKIDYGKGEIGGIILSFNKSAPCNIEEIDKYRTDATLLLDNDKKISVDINALHPLYDL